MTDDRDFSWMGPPAPKPAVMSRHALWSRTKRGHQVGARARVTSFGPEILILLDGELWWSHVYRCGTTELLTAEADRKRDGFIGKGWARTPQRRRSARAPPSAIWSTPAPTSGTCVGAPAVNSRSPMTLAGRSPQINAQRPRRK